MHGQQNVKKKYAIVASSTAVEIYGRAQIDINYISCPASRMTHPDCVVGLTEVRQSVNEQVAQLYP